MIFSFAYWPITVTFALISALLACGIAYVPTSLKDSSKKSRGGESASAVPFSYYRQVAIASFIVALLLERILFYYFQPTLTGSFGGMWWPIVFALVPAVGFGLRASRGNGLLQAIALVLITLIVPTVQYLWNAAGPDNAKRFAELANVTVAAPTDTIPPADEHHLVQVTERMADQKAQAILSSKPGYSTQYTVGKMTLQAIKGHRYWAAPLEPNNFSDTTWTPLWGGRSTSPGYVMVDAEDYRAAPQLHDGFQMSLFTDMPFGNNLKRFIYQAGYDKGTLDDPTFEVDDNLQPHYTVTYTTPAFGGIAGSVVAKVIVVDVAKSEPVLHEYAPGDDRIGWVDRVLSDSQVIEYANDWGVYGQKYPQSGVWAWFMTWTGFSKQDTMIPADGEKGMMHSYTRDDHNILVVPMTSQNSDTSVMGLLVFESNKVKATYYPGLNGFNHAGSASQTMFSTPGNGVTKYDVENMELYNIYGHLTWVGIYTHSQDKGSTYGGIGFMDAKSQDVADVAYSQDIHKALTLYSNRIGGGGNGRTATDDSTAVAINGTIWRIARNGDSYRFQLVGDAKHYFDVTTDVYQGSPLLRDGDHVSGSYADTDQVLATVSTLKLDGNGPATPAATASDKK